MENQTVEILSLNIEILKYLLLWPRPSISDGLNKVLLYGYFCLSVSFFTPVIWAVLYQVYMGIDDVDIMLEALIAVFDIVGYMVAYILFLRNKNVIEKIITDIQNFLPYCPAKVIVQTDGQCSRYTKYMFIYVSIGVSFNLSWPLMNRLKCIDEQSSDFYLRHDPCGMPTHNFYPFDASRPVIFWCVFLAEGIYVCHICYLFSMVTVTIVGLLMHITTQLRHCGVKFEEINYRNRATEEFVDCVRYHRDILVYAQRIFSVFSAVVVAYVTITSFATAVIGYQIVNARNVQDMLRYAMLLFAWGLLFYLICLHAHKVQNESVAIANCVYRGTWYTVPLDPILKRNIIMVIARAQRPLYFKIECLGIISLSRFVAVMKTAYSFFTILLTVADKN